MIILELMMRMRILGMTKISKKVKIKRIIPNRWNLNNSTNLGIIKNTQNRTKTRAAKKKRKNEK